MDIVLVLITVGILTCIAIMLLAFARDMFEAAPIGVLLWVVLTVGISAWIIASGHGPKVNKSKSCPEACECVCPAEEESSPRSPSR